MSTSIAWTDSAGSATLTNGKPGPAARFSAWRNWSPTEDNLSQSEVGVGTGDTFVWSFREDHLASFELRAIPMASLALLQRLKRHLETGGQATVTVGDADEHEYVCKIAPRTKVEYGQSDPQRQEYTLSLTLRNTANLPLLASY